MNTKRFILVALMFVMVFSSGCFFFKHGSGSDVVPVQHQDNIVTIVGTVFEKKMVSVAKLLGNRILIVQGDQTPQVASLVPVVGARVYCPSATDSVVLTDEQGKYSLPVNLTKYAQWEALNLLKPSIVDKVVVIAQKEGKEQKIEVPIPTEPPPVIIVPLPTSPDESGRFLQKSGTITGICQSF